MGRAHLHACLRQVRKAVGERQAARCAPRRPWGCRPAAQAPPESGRSIRQALRAPANPRKHGNSV
eukprot:6191329-Pleurochrysis_carterae.AAC.3